MSKKLSIIRFKPKPEHYDDFLQDVIENGKERDPGTHFVMKKDDEIIALLLFVIQRVLNKMLRTV